ncbi:MAG: hypothetical protein ACR2O4_06275 [Hyphomicrobiaceae bacterium]
MRYLLASTVLTFGLLHGGSGTGSFVETASAQTKNYGCFRIVNATSVRVRRKPYLWSKTLDYVQRGDKVVKNRKFCSVRRTWCRVQAGETSGWVGTKFLEETSC